MIKKTVSLIVALTVALNMTGIIGLASDNIVEVSLTPTADCYIYKQEDTPHSDNDTLSVAYSTTGSWDLKKRRASFINFDFSDYKNNPDKIKEAVLTMTSGSTVSDVNLKVYLLPDEYEGANTNPAWSCSELTCTQAVTLGLTDCIISENLLCDTESINLTKKISFNTADIKEKIITHLKNSSNGNITLLLDTDNATGYNMYSVDAANASYRPKLKLKVDNTKTDAEILSEIKEQLDFDVIKGENSSEQSVLYDLVLPEMFNEASIAWSSFPEGIIDTDTGVVTRPNSSTDAEVKLTATITYGTANDSKEFNLTVKRNIPDSELLEEAMVDLTFDTIKGENLSPDDIKHPLSLPTTGLHNTQIVWKSENKAITINDETGEITFPYKTEGASTGKLIATLTCGSANGNKEFDLTVPAGENLPEELLNTEYCLADSAAYVRKNREEESYVGQLVLDCSSSATRIGFIKFDLTEYEDIISKMNSVSLRITTAASLSSGNSNDFTVYLMKDSKENANLSGLTYKAASEQGLIGNDNAELVHTQTPGLSASTAYYSVDISEAVKDNLEKGNKTLLFRIEQTQGIAYTLMGMDSGDSFMPALKIDYQKPEHEMDALTLSLPSATDSDIELPNTGLFGSKITWATSNSSIIDIDGTVNTGVVSENMQEQDSFVKLTATVLSQDEKYPNAVRTFDVRVRRYATADADIDYSINESVTDKTGEFLSVGGSDNDIAVISADVSDYYEYAKNKRKIVLKLYTQESYVGEEVSLTCLSGSDLISDKDELNSLIYSDITALSMSESEYNTTVKVTESNILCFDITEYVWDCGEERLTFILSKTGKKIRFYSSDGYIGKVPGVLIAQNVYTDEYGAATAAESIRFTDISSDYNEANIRHNLILPENGRFGAAFKWSSTSGAVNPETGVITRGSTDTEVVLILTARVGDETAVKEFNLTVKKQETDNEYAEFLINTLSFDNSIITDNITLPGEELPDGATVSWSSSDLSVAQINGGTVEITRSPLKEVTVILKAVLAVGEGRAEKEFPFTLIRSGTKNLLKNKKIVSGDMLAALALDDDSETVWEKSNSTLVIDLSSAKMISSFMILPEGSSFSGITIEISEDSNYWTELYNGGSFVPGKLNYIEPDNIGYGRYLRFTFPQTDVRIAYLGGYSTLNENATDEFSSIVIPQSATASFDLPQSTNGYTITWISSSQTVVINGLKAIVNRGASAENVTLTATITVNGETKSKSYVVYVSGKGEGGSGGGLGGGGGSGGGGSGGGSSFGGNGGSDKIGGVDKPVHINTETPEMFNDLSGSEWAKSYIEELAKLEIVNGIGDGRFAPINNIKREEMAKIIVSAFNVPEGDELPQMNDLSENEWYFVYVKALINSKIAQGTGNNNFGVGENILRQDAFCMIAKALGMPDNIQPVHSFNDDEKISLYARNAVHFLKNIGIISGDDKNCLNPTAYITRAEACKIIFLAMEYLKK